MLYILLYDYYMKIIQDIDIRIRFRLIVVIKYLILCIITTMFCILYLYEQFIILHIYRNDIYKKAKDKVLRINV